MPTSFDKVCLCDPCLEAFSICADVREEALVQSLRRAVVRIGILLCEVEELQVGVRASVWDSVVLTRRGGAAFEIGSRRCEGTPRGADERWTDLFVERPGA